jgi:CBS domain-containing protein
MRIKDVMTKDPSCCVPSDSAQHAASIMRTENAGVVPVIQNEQSRRIVGVVTDRDLCMTVVAEGRDPSSVTVEQCMTTKVVTCRPEDPVDTATALMRDNQIRRVPVVGERGELEGIVALADIVGRGKVKAGQTHETLKQVSAPTDEPSKPRAESRAA